MEPPTVTWDYIQIRNLQAKRPAQKMQGVFYALSDIS